VYITQHATDNPRDSIFLCLVGIHHPGVTLSPLLPLTLPLTPPLAANGAYSVIMSLSSLTSSTHPRFTGEDADRILEYLHFAAPIILLVFFLFAFSAHSIASSKSTGKPTSTAVQYGPLGKPLPTRSQSYRAIAPRDFSRSRKLTFEWLTVFVCFTFVANAGVVILHALAERRNHWWAGQSVTVSPNNSMTRPPNTALADLTLHCRSTLSAPSSSTRCSSSPSSTPRLPQPLHISQHGVWPWQLMSSCWHPTFLSTSGPIP
jgi:hypothetical protein